MDKLTPAQAQALFDAGGFIVISGLPQGSEFGIDGTYHITRRFSGIKFLPPGLHLVTWSPPPSSTPGPSTIPIKSALLRISEPRERILLSYDAQTENVSLSEGNEETVISEDHLRTLDPELAPYPFSGSNAWSTLTDHIIQDVLDQVIGPDGRVDGMMLVDGEEDELSELNKAKTSDQQSVLDPSQLDTKRLKFPKFDLKRSWRSGDVGDEVTRYSRDKSWLLGDLVKTQFNHDPMRIISLLQLSFILLLHLSSYSSLMVYKRFLALLTRSSELVAQPSLYIPRQTHQDIAVLYLSFIHTLRAQLSALPDQVFESELPEMDLFFQDELAYLRQNLGQGMPSWTDPDCSSVKVAWEDLREVVKRWKWDIPPLSSPVDDDEDDEDEEGEYAPAIVET